MVDTTEFWVCVGCQKLESHSPDMKNSRTSRCSYVLFLLLNMIFPVLTRINALIKQRSWKCYNLTGCCGESVIGTKHGWIRISARHCDTPPETTTDDMASLTDLGTVGCGCEHTSLAQSRSSGSRVAVTWTRATPLLSPIITHPEAYNTWTMTRGLRNYKHRQGTGIKAWRLRREEI
jgi:hypothetical protein